MKSKPVIGITKPDNEDFFAFGACWLSIRLAGGDPLVLTPSSDYESADIDGLLLGGGKDVFPERYNQSPKEEYQYDQKRDEMEVFWAERARDEDIPTLGICRGAQLMNVMCGGTLHMSVAEAYEDAHYPDGLIHNALYRKSIEIEDGCLLHRITKRKNLMVNSIHKQAVAKLGDGLVINAKEDNGVIQAIAHDAHSFFLGIQFHPEFLIYRKTVRLIFDAFIDAAKSRIA